MEPPLLCSSSAVSVVNETFFIISEPVFVDITSSLSNLLPFLLYPKLSEFCMNDVAENILDLKSFSSMIAIY